MDCLWMGRDHILWVRSGFFHENYRRFYYRDIRYIVTRKTSRGKAINVVFGLLSTICVLFAFILRDIRELETTLAFFGAAFLLFLAINALLGPTCETHLQTALGLRKLHSLKRLGSTLKAMELLKPAIENAQAGLVAGDPARIPGANLAAALSPANDNGPAALKRHVSGAWHAALYLMLTVSGILTAVHFFYPEKALLTTIPAGFASAGLVCVAALVRQIDSDLSGTLSKLTWFSFVFLCTSLGLFEIGRMFVSVVISPDGAYNLWTFIQGASRISPMDNPAVAGAHFYFACGGIALGAAGLYMLSQRKTGRQKTRPEEEKVE